MFQGIYQGKRLLVSGQFGKQSPGCGHKCVCSHFGFNLKVTDKIMNDSFRIGVFPGMSKAKLDCMMDKNKEGVKK